MPTRSEYDEPSLYKIRVKGILGPSWSDWFDHFSISSQGNDTTLRGLVADQAALLGILNKINDLGLVILAVARVGRKRK